MKNTYIIRTKNILKSTKYYFWFNYKQKYLASYRLRKLINMKNELRLLNYP